jgi:hypothetical protein
MFNQAQAKVLYSEMKRTQKYYIQRTTPYTSIINQHLLSVAPILFKNGTRQQRTVVQQKGPRILKQKLKLASRSPGHAGGGGEWDERSQLQFL